MDRIEPVIELMKSDDRQKAKEITYRVQSKRDCKDYRCFADILMEELDKLKIKNCNNCEGFIKKSKKPPYNAFDYIVGNEVGVCNFTEDVTPLSEIKYNCPLWEIKEATKDTDQSSPR